MEYIITQATECKEIGHLLASVYKQSYTTRNECRTKEQGSNSERKRGNRNLPTDNSVVQVVQNGTNPSVKTTETV